jgi:hypothetical protein
LRKRGQRRLLILSIISTVSIIPAYPIILKNVVDRVMGGFSVSSNQ